MKTTTKTRKATTIKRPAPAAESMVNNAPRTFTEADFPVGTVAHQGDLILVRIADLPSSAKPRKDRQLAEGNTQGSRHVVQTGDVFDADTGEVEKSIKSVCPKSNPESRYVGPLFRTSDGVADLVHPEHGPHLYRGDMVVACYYQRNQDAEERERRTVD